MKENIKAGRNICIAEATVTDIKGKHLAHGKSKQMVTPGLQSIPQLVSAMGYMSFPPKFIVADDLDQTYR